MVNLSSSFCKRLPGRGNPMNPPSGSVRGEPNLASLSEGRRFWHSCSHNFYAYDFYITLRINKQINIYIYIYLHRYSYIYIYYMHNFNFLWISFAFACASRLQCIHHIFFKSPGLVDHRGTSWLWSLHPTCYGRKTRLANYPLVI